MKKIAMLVTTLLLITAVSAVSVQTTDSGEQTTGINVYKGELTTDKESYNRGEPVIFTFENVGTGPIRTRGLNWTFWIERFNGRNVSEQYCAMEITPLVYWEPGDNYSWTWNQTYLVYDRKDPACPTKPPTGHLVPPGRYTGKVEWWPEIGVPGYGVAEAAFEIKPGGPPTEEFPPGQGGEHASDEGLEHGQAFQEGWFPPGLKKGKGVPFLTIDKGFISYYRYGDENFTGEYKVIRNQEEWEAFWDNHTKGMVPQPEVPEVNFHSRMVLVALQGYRTTCCGYYINFTWVKQNGTTLDVYVHKSESPGPLPLVTNPYHIIKTKKAANVSFIEI